MGAAILSLLAATWRTARQSKAYEDGLRDLLAIKLHLFGDKILGKKGALDDVEEAKSASLYAARSGRLIFRAFRVPEASSDEEIVAHVREVINTSNVLNTGQYPTVVVDALGRVVPRGDK